MMFFAKISFKRNAARANDTAAFEENMTKFEFTNLLSVSSSVETDEVVALPVEEVTTENTENGSTDSVRAVVRRMAIL